MMVAQTSSEDKLEQSGFYASDSGAKAAEVDTIGAIEMDNSQRVSSMTQTRLLFKREFANLHRNKIPLVARFGITIFLNVLFGLIFQGIGKYIFNIYQMLNSELNQIFYDFLIGGSDSSDQTSIQSHFGALVMVMISAMFGTAQPALIQFPSERPVFLRGMFVFKFFKSALEFTSLNMC